MPLIRVTVAVTEWRKQSFVGFVQGWWLRFVSGFHTSTSRVVSLDALGSTSVKGLTEGHKGQFLDCPSGNSDSDIGELTSVHYRNTIAGAKQAQSKCQQIQQAGHRAHPHSLSS